MQGWLHFAMASPPAPAMEGIIRLPSSGLSPDSLIEGGRVRTGAVCRSSMAISLGTVAVTCPGLTACCQCGRHSPSASALPSKAVARRTTFHVLRKALHLISLTVSHLFSCGIVWYRHYGSNPWQGSFLPYESSWQFSKRPNTLPGPPWSCFVGLFII